MPRQPLGEVFGFSADNFTAQAEYYRQNRLCPFNNKVPSCTKDKANDPLGVCSVNHNDGVVITCPIRFRQDWRIAVDAADFFFAPGTAWTSLVEIGITDGDGLAAGNIDVVLVSYDDYGRLTDFGALEVQAVYISGNVRRPFEQYMQNRSNELAIDWSGMPLYPRPDYLSSSRKRLAPQLLYKGSILKGWGKKQAVAVQRSFFRTLPELPQAAPEEADLVWLIYDLDYDTDHKTYVLVLKEQIYTRFDPALDRITKPKISPIAPFVEMLQLRLDAKLTGGSSPDVSTLLDIVEPDVTERGSQ